MRRETAAPGHCEGLAQPVDEGRAIGESSNRVGRSQDANPVGDFFFLRYICQKPFDFQQPSGCVADRRIAGFEPDVGAIVRPHAKFVLGG